jgi:hypothetical protein
MVEQSFLSGKVRKYTLPILKPPLPPEPLPLKRLLLPQGELAQIHDSDQPIHYLAFIELREGAIRGNHYHKLKQETVYILQGGVLLTVAEPGSTEHTLVSLHTGDLVVIYPDIAHALTVEKSGLAVEFSPSRFDAADIYRYPLVQSLNA